MIPESRIHKAVLLLVCCTLKCSHGLELGGNRGLGGERILDTEDILDQEAWERLLHHKRFYGFSMPIPLPTPRPTNRPTRIPTPRPTPKPTSIPTPRPTPRPTMIPTPRPSPRPTPRPTHLPTPRPTPRPSPIPLLTPQPNEGPVVLPPTPRPTPRPSPIPTRRPSPRPTPRPTQRPSPIPTPQPTDRINPVTPLPVPSPRPTPQPTPRPSPLPTTSPVPPPTNPPVIPIAPPSIAPVEPPTNAPVPLPTDPLLPPPSSAPVSPPTNSPLPPPTGAPIAPPTNAPVPPPTVAPIAPPTSAPILPPTNSPLPPPTSTPVPPPTIAPVASPPTPVPVTSPPTSPPMPGLMTLLFLIQNTQDFSILSNAITAADLNRNAPPRLAELLNSPDADLTAFAPVNSAFENLNLVAPGYFDQLLTPDFSLHLFNLLAFHITNGRVTTEDFPITDLEMLRSGTVDVTADRIVQTVAPTAAQILDPTDFQASNGLAQVVNNVLLPQFAADNLLSALQARSNMFSTLLQLIEAAGLSDTIAGLSGVTLLAPTNDAIQDETVEFLLADGNEALLQSTVTYHIIDSLFNCAIQSVPNILLRGTAQGENIVIGLIFDDNNPGEILVSFNSATRQGEILTQQNIIYPTDVILVPPSNSTVVPRSIGTFDPTVLMKSINTGEVVFVQQSRPDGPMDMMHMVSFLYSSWHDWESVTESAETAVEETKTTAPWEFVSTIMFRMSNWYQG